MKLGQYISELLLENETVIIPGFGAFISNYKSAEIDKESEEIIPPSKEISFNQKIRNNDGLLVGYVAEKQSLSHFDALKKIEKERENIIYHLDKGEHVILKKTGELFLNKKHEIQFDSFIKDNLLLDSFGLEPISLAKEEVIISEEVEIKQDTKIEIPPKEPEIVPEAVAAEESEEKKKRGWLWFLLIFVPIIIAGIFVANKEFNPKRSGIEIQNNEPEDLPVESKISTNVVDSALNDSTKTAITDSVQIENILVDSAIIINPDTPKFYLVGGSFKEETNANKFIEQFNYEGYEPFLFGKRGSFFIVAIGTYSTERDAVNAMDAFKEKNPDSEIWYFKDKSE